MRRGPFTRSALILLLTCGLALFALSVLLPAYDDGTPGRGDTARAGTYSVSAIGHAGVYDMLRRLDFPVSRGRGHTLDMVGGGTLMVIEPDPWRLDDELGPRLLMEVPSLVLVLPKWRGVPDKRHSGWPLVWADKKNPAAVWPPGPFCCLNLLADDLGGVQGNHQLFVGGDN